MFMPLFSYADEVIDSLIVRVEYYVQAKNIIEQDLGTDLYALEIGNMRSRFHNMTKQQYNEAYAEYCGDNHTIEMFLKFFNAPNRPPQYNCGYDIYRNYPKEGLFTTTDVIRREFFYICEDSIPQLEWELLEGDTIIATYPCQKAICEFHGRKWTAWYTLDIPYEYGPWKLCGLPGLILTAWDNENFFSFECVKIEYDQTSPIVFESGNYEKCTTKRLNELKYDFWQDQMGFMSIKYGEKTTGNFPGSPQKIFTFCPMEKF